MVHYSNPSFFIFINLIRFYNIYFKNIETVFFYYAISTVQIRILNHIFN